MSTRWLDRRRALALAVALLSLLSLGGGATFAAFSSTTSNGSNAFSAAPDWVAPTAGRSTMASVAGGAAGTIARGQPYYVYANVTDTGNPAAGVASVTADVSAVTAGQAAVALSAGSWTVGGQTYNRRSASLTAAAGLSAGSKAYRVTSTDAASPANGGTDGFTVTISATVPTATDVQAANGGATVSRPEQGDTVTFTFSAAMSPGTILAGWSGAATNTVVRITNGGGGANDVLTVWNATDTTQANLGSVDLGRGDYVNAGGGGLRTFGLTGTPSSMVLSGAAITVTLGTPNANAKTAAGTGTMIWTPSTAATDTFGMPLSGALATETGGADRDF